MDPQLAKKLAQRKEGSTDTPSSTASSGSLHVNYSDFPEFSRKEIKEIENLFKTHNSSGNGFMDLQELKLMMEKLGHPQTHVGLKQMMAEVDIDKDNMLSLKEFFTIFSKASKGELTSAGLNSLAQSIDVSKEGVGGAKNFFQAKIAQQEASNRNEQEIKAEQAQKKVERQAQAQRKADFKTKASMFENQ